MKNAAKRTRNVQEYTARTKASRDEPDAPDGREARNRSRSPATSSANRCNGDPSARRDTAGLRRLPVFKTSATAPLRIAQEKEEPAGKPGSVVSSHSSRSCVAAGLERPTRERRGPRHGSPIRSCSRWGLPCRSVARLAVRSYRTVSPLPDPVTPSAQPAIGGLLSVALSVGSRRPGVTWHPALWSPDFPRHPLRRRGCLAGSRAQSNRLQRAACAALSAGAATTTPAQRPPEPAAPTRSVPS